MFSKWDPAAFRRPLKDFHEASDSSAPADGYWLSVTLIFSWPPLRASFKPLLSIPKEVTTKESVGVSWSLKTDNKPKTQPIKHPQCQLDITEKGTIVSGQNSWYEEQNSDEWQQWMNSWIHEWCTFRMAIRLKLFWHITKCVVSSNQDLLFNM